MRRAATWMAGAAASLVAALLLAGAANARALDCPKRDRPYSVDTTLLDILLSPAARAALERASPTLLAGLPPRILATTPPTQAEALTPRSLYALKHMDSAGIAPLDAALRAVRVTAADRVARCARYDATPLVLPPPSDRPRVLVFEKITGFRDGPSVEAARAALLAIGARRGWDMVVTDQGGAMTDATLRRVAAVVWNNVSGDVLTRAERAAFRRYIEHGGGFVGIHGSGGDAAYDWRWYVERLIGAQFAGHPLAPQFQDARLVVDDPADAIVAGFGRGWTLNDEWYSFAASPRGAGTHVLLTLDEASYSPREGNRSIAMGADHPIAWTRCVGNGRAFYSAIGHRPETYADPHHLALLDRALAWAAGIGATRCASGRELAGPR